MEVELHLLQNLEAINIIYLKQKKRTAISIAISIRNNENSLKIINNFHLKEGKTSIVNKALKLLNVKSVLIVDNENKMLKQGIRNIPKAKYLNSKGINVYDILKYQSLIITKQAIEDIEKKLII